MMKRYSVGLLLLLLAFAWLGTLGLRPLYKPDEARYGEISREMASSGDWITPRLNGFKYFEKPPLQYWATAALFQAFGETDFIARLWTALLALAGIGLVMFAGNRLFDPPAGSYAAAILAGSPLYVLAGQVSTLDMALAFFLCAAIVAFARGHMLLFWLACALAVLSKGPVGIVLPLCAIALYAALRRDFAVLKGMRFLAGGALFLGLAAPWFIVVSLKNPEFAKFFFIHEHFERFTSRVHDRWHPAWYYIPILALGMFPFLLPTLVAWARTAGKARAEGFNTKLFLGVWALVVFVFFSASSSSLPAYILPMFPALALLGGAWLASANPRPVLLAQAVLGALAGAVIGVAGSSQPGYGPWLVAAGLCVGLASAGAALLVLRGLASGAIAVLAIGGFSATQIAIAGHGSTFSARFSAQSTIAALPGKPGPDARIFAVDGYDHSIPWALRRTVTLVIHQDELGPGIAAEPDKFLPDLKGFALAWEMAPEAYAFFPAEGFDESRAKAGVSMEVIARGPRYVVVRKPPPGAARPSVQ